jgi:hypothetical protein
MSLTRNGKTTGKAASTELREQRQYILEEQRNFQRDFMWNYGAALDQLRVLDPDWSTWYDQRPEQTTKEMYPVILARVEELKEMDELVKLARNIRSTMHDSIQTVQMNKAEYALKIAMEELISAEVYKISPPSNCGDWVGWMQDNAKFYMDKARMFLNTEYIV